jgi:hypothetical protein
MVSLKNRTKKQSTAYINHTYLRAKLFGSTFTLDEVAVEF